MSAARAALHTRTGRIAQHRRKRLPTSMPAQRSLILPIVHSPRRRRADAKDISCSTGLLRQSGDTQRQQGTVLSAGLFPPVPATSLHRRTRLECDTSALPSKFTVFVTRGEREAVMEVLSRRTSYFFLNFDDELGSLQFLHQAATGRNQFAILQYQWADDNFGTALLQRRGREFSALALGGGRVEPFPAQ